jgi:hypothetical protein
MDKTKYDGVIEAVHYNENGQVEWVRAYERRGPAFSDTVLFDRGTLIEQLKAGKIFFIGQRILYMGSSFEVSQPVRIIEVDGKEVLVSGDMTSEQDCLEGAPII